MRIGIHTSIAKSLAGAAIKAHELGANCFQIFSSSPRMWRASVLAPADIAELKRLRVELDLHPLVVHGSYLVNLASLDETTLANSLAAFRAELERCLAIGADYLVIHPGSCKGQTADEAIVRVAAAIGVASEGLEYGPLTLLFENTAGAGNTLGVSWRELAALRELTGRRTALRLGYCLDTAHCLASGHDVASKEGWRQTLQSVERELGLEHVPVIHANDSKTPLGSRVDRHDHIGEGYIGRAGFRRMLRDPLLAGKAFILETPIDEEGDDLRNVAELKRLAGLAGER